MVRTVLRHPDYSLLAIGIALVLLALAHEWHTIANHLRVTRLSLAAVEHSHPRLPGRVEVCATAGLTAMVAVLFVQFIATVYAMSFTLSSSTAESKNTVSVILLDIDGDGDLDYVAGNKDGTGTFDHDLYTNDGTGIFSHGGTFGDSTDLKAVQAGDIDGDGDIDVVSLRSDGGTYSTISGSFNNGAGSFTTSTVASLPLPAETIVLFDADNDGDLDCFLGTQGSSVITQRLYLNNGRGGFTAAASTLGESPDITAADFDGDGDIDMAVIQGGNVVVYRNSGTGAFVSLASIATGGTTSSKIASGDVDGDGDIDMLMAMDSTGIVTIRFNGGNGASWGNGTDFGSVAYARRVYLGDVDNDGDLDAVIAASDTLAGTNGGNEIWVNDGSGTFSQSGTPTEEADCTRDLALGDIDGDGDLDYVAGNDDSSCGTAGGVNRHYRNDQAATAANAAPGAPSTGFGATLVTAFNTVTTVDSVGTVGQDVSIAVSSDGFPVIGYRDFTNADLKVLKCGNASCSSGNTVTTADSAGNVGEDSSITVPADGLPVISYYDGTNGDLKVLKCGNASCSSGNTVTTVDSAGDVGVDPSVTVSPDGFPVISYYDGTNGDLKVLKCGNASCSSGNTVTTVDSAGDVGSQSSIAVPGDGLPVISYRDLTNLDVKTVKCGSSACDSGNTVTTVDSAGNVGLYMSMAVPSDGLPAISYYDLTNGDLKLTKCGNASCSSGNTATVVDSAGDVGLLTSTAVFPDGAPLISYYDNSSNDLKVARCGNAACSSGTTLSRVDSAGDVGQYAAVAVPSDGLPVIGYYDLTNTDLKAAKCGNSSCSGGGSSGGANIRLTWGSGSDAITATRLLQYRLRVGTGSLGHTIQPGNTGSPNYTTRLMPNGQSRTMLLRGIACGRTYYWGVRTVDSGLKVSAESPEQTATVAPDCTIGSGGSPPPPRGGTLWKMTRGTGGGTATGGLITGRLFLDLNGDGQKGRLERWIRMKGVRIAFTQGKTAAVAVTDRTGAYRVNVTDGTHAVTADGRSMPDFVTTASGKPLTVVTGEEKTYDVPVRWAHLVRYAPCLELGTSDPDESRTDAEQVLSVLTDRFGTRIAADAGKRDDLVQRMDFLQLLAKTQCIEPPRSAQAARAALKKRKLNAFADLPIAGDAGTLRIYGLLAAGVPVRSGGGLFDGNGYITRAEAAKAVAAAMDLAAWSKGRRKDLQDIIPPADVDDQRLGGAVRALSLLDVLPGYMLETFAGERGLTRSEAAGLLSAAAFAAGRVDMTDAAPSPPLMPAFMRTLGGMDACWSEDDTRVRALSVADVRPGSGMMRYLLPLLPLGTAAGGGVAWVLPGEEWATDLGVREGRMKLLPAAAPSIAETLRMLSVFACLPVPGRAETAQAMALGRKTDSGVPDQLLTRDRIAGLREDMSFASRVLLHAQRPTRTGNLSPVFSFTDVLISDGNRRHDGPVSIDEGAELIASTLLQMRVRRGALSRLQAEGVMRQLTHDIRAFLLDGREGVNAANAVLTRADMVRVLGTIAAQASGEEGTLPGAAEVWWGRVRQEH